MSIISINLKKDLVKRAVFSALSRSRFQAVEADEIQKIEDNITAQLSQNGLLLAPLAELENEDNFTKLTSALQGEFQQGVERLLLLFSFIYDSSTVRQIGDYLNYGSGQEQSRAVEMIDLLFERKHKLQLLPMVDPELTTAQRLTGLPKESPVPEKSGEEWVQTIIENNAGRYDDCTQAYAIFEAMGADSAAWQPVVEAGFERLTSEAQPLSHEATQRLLAKNLKDQAMLTIEKIAVLKETNVFKDLQDSVLASIAQIVEVLELPANLRFIQEGEIANEMFVIADGRVRVVRNDTLVIELNQGDTVGELAVFDPEPRSADVETAEPTILLKLDRALLRDVMLDQPEISEGIIQALARRIREQGRLMTAE